MFYLVSSGAIFGFSVHRRKDVMKSEDARVRKRREWENFFLFVLPTPCTPYPVNGWRCLFRIPYSLEIKHYPIISIPLILCSKFSIDSNSSIEVFLCFGALGGVPTLFRPAKRHELKQGASPQVPPLPAPCIRVLLAANTSLKMIGAPKMHAMVCLMSRKNGMLFCCHDIRLYMS